MYYQMLIPENINEINLNMFILFGILLKRTNAQKKKKKTTGCLGRTESFKQTIL